MVAVKTPMLPDFLWHGAEAYGFRGQVQTCGRVAQVMRIMWQFSYRAGWNIDQLSYSKMSQAPPPELSRLSNP